MGRCFVNAEPVTLVEFHKPSQCPAQRLKEPVGPGHPGFQDEIMEMHQGFLSRGLAIHSRHESAVPEEGEGEVAVAPLGGGTVTFDLIIEPEELLDSLALDHEIVEGRKDFEWA